MRREVSDWKDAADDAYSHLNERKREYPVKNMLSLIDDFCLKGTASQSELIEKHGPIDFIATTLGHVTTAVYGKGSVPKQGGWYRATPSSRIYYVHPSFAEAWAAKRHKVLSIKTAKQKPTEDQLCLAFAERAKDSQECISWILSHTKFKNHGSTARLLHDEQMRIRPRKFWWRHWWCHVPELKKDRETDIFMVFEIADSKKRFALHFENKTNNGTFANGQAEAYQVRAKHMANKPEYLNYTDFETVLISPLSFRKRYPKLCECFNSYISYEDICKFVPEFES